MLSQVFHIQLKEQWEKPEVGGYINPQSTKKSALNVSVVGYSVLKVQLKEIMMNDSGDRSLTAEKIQAESELLQLKKEWKEWEKKREAAARERMIALGHIER